MRVALKFRVHGLVYVVADGAAVESRGLCRGRYVCHRLAREFQRPGSRN